MVNCGDVVVKSVVKRGLLLVAFQASKVGQGFEVYFA
jgi:hypothetical protein